MQGTCRMSSRIWKARVSWDEVDHPEVQRPQAVPDQRASLVSTFLSDFTMEPQHLRLQLC